ncbi:conserved hypothetical protein [Culex quinquefasciatus]|uniref:Uncharacterized protein n=1 Tax=Culex quinquefasciatus TaxID=7176 RepID=B0XLE4_CULQU|nr:conserved hypothetical protein [Culex quinquefasciatus]|eukprot:XP_001870466.1 conserved hypothetical protein [Culex quinquefasciatus]
MAVVWKVLLCLIAATCSAQKSPTSYSASLIRYLSDQSSGIVDVWFLQLSNDPEQHELMEELLLSEELYDIPKRLISTRYASRLIERQPELLLIFGNYHAVTALRTLFAYVFFPNFKESVKIILFHQCSSRVEFARINSVFVMAKLFNVVYIRTDQLEVDYCLHYRDEFHGWHGEADFVDLFVDQTADLDGTVLHISFSFITLDGVFSRKKGVFNGRLLEWVFGTIEHVNGTCASFPDK